MNEEIQAQQMSEAKPFRKAEIAKMRAEMHLITGPSAGYFREFRARVIATAERDEAIKTDLLAACEAAEQCMADFIEIYKRDCSMIVMDEAVRSMRDDGFKKVRAALKKAKGVDDAKNKKAGT